MSTDPADPRRRDSDERQFARWLASLAQNEDRAALAALRRGLGRPPGETPEMYPYVFPHLPDYLSRTRQDDYFLVAALFGLHPSSASARSFGGSLSQLQQQTESAGAERVMVALLNAQWDELPHHLRRAVALLRSHDVPIDWERLLDDLRWWRSPSRSIQRRWARDFWAANAPVAAKGDDDADGAEDDSRAGEEDGTK